MTYAHTRIIASLGLVALLGFGCEAPKEGREGAQGSKNATAEVGTESPAPSDGEPVVSGEGKAVYESEKFKFSFAYPKGWSIRDKQTEASFVIDLHPSPLPPADVTSDFVAAISIQIDDRSLAQAIDDLSPYQSKEVEVIGNGDVTKILYEADLPEEHTAIAYLFPIGQTLYQVVSRPDNMLAKEIVAAIMTSAQMGG